jgi:hypothetical protein
MEVGQGPNWGCSAKEKQIREKVVMAYFNHFKLMFTTSTTSFSIKETSFCSHAQCMFRMTLIINNINRFVFVIEMQCLYCEVGNEVFSII